MLEYNKTVQTLYHCAQITTWQHLLKVKKPPQHKTIKLNFKEVASKKLKNKLLKKIE
jgi:hypothetical protein